MPLAETDPFRCAVAFRALVGQPRGEVEHLFRYVIEQVAIVPVSPEALILPDGEIEGEPGDQDFVEDARRRLAARDFAGLRKPSRALSGQGRSGLGRISFCAGWMPCWLRRCRMRHGPRRWLTHRRWPRTSLGESRWACGPRSTAAPAAKLIPSPPVEAPTPDTPMAARILDEQMRIIGMSGDAKTIERRVVDKVKSTIRRWSAWASPDVPDQKHVLVQNARRHRRVWWGCLDGPRWYELGRRRRGRLVDCTPNGLPKGCAWPSAMAATNAAAHPHLAAARPPPHRASAIQRRPRDCCLREQFRDGNCAGRRSPVPSAVVWHPRRNPGRPVRVHHLPTGRISASGEHGDDRHLLDDIAEQVLDLGPRLAHQRAECQGATERIGLGQRHEWFAEETRSLQAGKLEQQVERIFAAIKATVIRQ